MKLSNVPQCAKCGKHICILNKELDLQENIKDLPYFCPMKEDQALYDQAWKEYQKSDVMEFARQASIQEAECYEHFDGGIRTVIPRVEETIQFAKKMKYKKLGIVFCIGLANEALMLNKILDKNNFDVISICCKTGHVSKDKIGIKPEQKIFSEYDVMCNPIAQAFTINKKKPEWVILMGLCVGHDTLFLKYCRVPVTILAVKDRVLAHNPLAALYLSNTLWYGRLNKPTK